jgi:hypothetical protein
MCAIGKILPIVQIDICTIELIPSIFQHEFSSLLALVFTDVNGIDRARRQTLESQRRALSSYPLKAVQTFVYRSFTAVEHGAIATPKAICAAVGENAVSACIAGSKYFSDPAIPLL